MLAIVGAGVQARAHLRLLPLVRDFAEVRIVARDPAAAERLVADHRAAPSRVIAASTTEGADVVCLTTSSSSPVLAASAVAPGTHVTSVGFAPPGGELDPALAASARLFVETLQAFAPPPAGCAELAGLDPSLGTALGDLLAGRAPAARRRTRSRSTRRWGTSPRTPRPPSSSTAPRSNAGVGRTVDL